MSESALFKRRQILKGLGLSGIGAIALRGYQVQAKAPVHFTHSVASGDPLQDRIILWTRVVPGSGKHRRLELEYQVAQDPSFNNIISQGKAATDKSRDYTVKVDATGLKAGQSYYYRFICQGISSPLGQTKTLNDGDVKEFRLSVVSCSNFPQGYFNTYRHIANSQVDAVVHLGDYIYEYKEGYYANPYALEKLGRNVQPQHEIVSLEDYRMRYGLYRTDADLMAVHARHPFICVWDDHELTNNTYKDGAQNHDESEGDFYQRMAWARQAYHEWLPIRTHKEGQQGPIYRRFKVGKLADLIMLDTRLEGRDRGYEYRHDLPPVMGNFDLSNPQQPRYMGKAKPGSQAASGHKHLPLIYDHSGPKAKAITDFARLSDLLPKLKSGQLAEHLKLHMEVAWFKQHKLERKDRTLLGTKQEQWLGQQLKDSNSTWQILGQQILMGKLGMPSIPADKVELRNGRNKPPAFLQFMREHQRYDLPMNLDAWDGYPAARERAYQQLKQYANNPVVLAGDTHNSWAFNLRNQQGEAIGVELGTPGVSSPGMESYIPTAPAVAKKAVMAASPEMIAAETSKRGWTEVVFTPQKVVSRWHYVSTVLSREFEVEAGESLEVLAGAKQFS